MYIALRRTDMVIFLLKANNSPPFLIKCFGEVRKKKSCTFSTRLLLIRKDNSVLYFIMLSSSVLSQELKGNIEDDMFENP